MISPGAPIMGTRKNKLLIASRDTIKMAKAVRIAYCKELCGDHGRIAVKDREHTPMCQKFTIRIQKCDTLYRGI